MPTVPEELDVFHVPHDHMKKIVRDIEDQLSKTDFHNSEEYVYLLEALSRNFKDLQSHEEIENNYIYSQLLPRLSQSAKATLEHDMHSSDRLHGLMCLVDSAPQFVDEFERMQYGESLKNSVISFTSEVLPHMEEEEEVFQPLLIEHYSNSELKELRDTILQLHRQQLSQEIQLKKNATHMSDGSASLTSLPQEILLKIFSHLSPQDLCHVSQTHPVFSDLAYDGSLWRSLHPVRWADGHWQFHQPMYRTSTGKISEDSVIANDTTKYLLSCGDSINASLCQLHDEGGEEEESGGFYQDGENPRLLKECEIMRGLIDCVLPRVGPHVEVLDLSYGKSLTGEMIHKMLSLCPNLHYLDLSYTQATDYSFRGLVECDGSRHLLEYINLSGCSNITDTALLRIAWSSTPPTSKRSCTGCSCGAFDSGGGGGVEGVADNKECELKCLILSGCHQITDVGLSSLAIGRGLPNLEYLNLTSLPRISAAGLNRLISTCPNLKPHLLFYCDNITNGPHPLNSNGCCNVECFSQCCQNMYES